MFTGIIELTAIVESLEPRPSGARLALRAGLEAALGDSISVSGACLTLDARKDGLLEFDLSAETLARTTLGRLKPGAAVNLERALRAGDPLGGHLVSGHVDGQGSLKSCVTLGQDAELEFSAPAQLLPLIADKGSIAVEGVSLTPFGVSKDGFKVALIPVTLQRTTLSGLKPGDPVNLEADLLARYVQRQLSLR